MCWILLDFIYFWSFAFSGGKIRGTIAQIPFDEFHRNSAQIIKMSVFGMDKDGNLNQWLKFDANNLVSQAHVNTCTYWVISYTTHHY